MLINQKWYMNYLIIRGEYPFDSVVDMLSADTADQALEQARYKYRKDFDVFVRHPVVEPLGDEPVFVS